MFSRRNEVRELNGLTLPEVIQEAAHAYRLLEKLSISVNQGVDTRDRIDEEAAFNRHLQQIFPETLPLLCDPIHVGLREFVRRNNASGVHFFVKAALLLSARFCSEEKGGAIREISYAHRLLDHAAECLKRCPHNELSAVCAMNKAIAIDRGWSPAKRGLEGLSKRSVDLWLDAIYTMPGHRWGSYPSLLSGTAHILAHLCRDSQGDGGFTSLASAVDVAKLAYHRLTTLPFKGTEIERERPTVALLVQIARTRQQAAEQGVPLSRLPDALQIVEQACINSSCSKESPRLFVETLINVAQMYMARADEPTSIDRARSALVVALCESRALSESEASPLRSEIIAILSSLPQTGDGGEEDAL